jgi:AAA+ ATPase superfamily predicted ATPase|tara:strand:+ start:5263 stop:5664 length:402 start_codon:yes stop_codon:yes gene_type:complete
MNRFAIINQFDASPQRVTAFLNFNDDGTVIAEQGFSAGNASLLNQRIERYREVFDEYPKYLNQILDNSSTLAAVELDNENNPITFDGDIIEDIKLDIPNMDSVTLRESDGFADDLAEFELFKDQTGYQVGGKE